LAQAILAQAKSQVSYGTPLAGAMGGQRALAVLRLPGGHMLYVNDELVAQRLVDRALPVCDASVAEHDLRTRLAVVEAGLRVQQELAHGLGRPVPVLSKAIQALRTLNSVAGVAKHQTEEEGGRPPKAEAAARSEGSAAPCGGRVLARHASEPEKEPGKQGERMDQENVMSQTMSENNGMHEYHGCGESTECGKHNGTFAENVTKEIAKHAISEDEGPGETRGNEHGRHCGGGSGESTRCDRRFTHAESATKDAAEHAMMAGESADEAEGSGAGEVTDSARDYASAAAMFAEAAELFKSEEDEGIASILRGCEHMRDFCGKQLQQCVHERRGAGESAAKEGESSGSGMGIEKRDSHGMQDHGKSLGRGPRVDTRAAGGPKGASSGGCTGKRRSRTQVGSRATSRAPARPS